MTIARAFQRLEAEMAEHSVGPLDERIVRAARIVEALLFAAREPLAEADIARVLPDGVEVRDVMRHLGAQYAGRGVELAAVAGKWMFRTAADLGYLLSAEAEAPKKLTRAGLETLAIIAYHQPVTRAEIEDIRGVATHRGTLDLLLETGWIRMRGRRRTPGRPITYGTTEAFLVQFSLDRLSDLPGLDELKGAGMMDGTPAGFSIPLPHDDPALRDDEDALEPDLFEELAEQRINEADVPLDPKAENEHR